MFHWFHWPALAEPLWVAEWFRILLMFCKTTGNPLTPSGRAAFGSTLIPERETFWVNTSSVLTKRPTLRVSRLGPPGWRWAGAPPCPAAAATSSTADSGNRPGRRPPWPRGWAPPAARTPVRAGPGSSRSASSPPPGRAGGERGCWGGALRCLRWSRKPLLQEKTEESGIFL